MNSTQCSKKCSIHNDYNPLCKNGDIISKDGRLYLVVNDTVICTQTSVQSPDYINIPLLVTQHIRNPYAFYSMLLNHNVCPHDCKVMEIHLSPIIHNRLIGKYFEPDERCRYTIIYPDIYEIKKSNMYRIKVKKLAFF